MYLKEAFICAKDLTKSKDAAMEQGIFHTARQFSHPILDFFEMACGKLTSNS